MTEVRAIFTTLCPIHGDSEGFADFFARALRHHLFTEFRIHGTRLLGRALTATRTRWRAFDDGLDQRATDRLVRDSVIRNIELEQTHGALDVHAHRSRIDMSRRNHHATYRCTVTRMSIGIEHQIGHPRRATGVERLSETSLIKAVTDRFRPDHRDRLALVIASRKKGFGFVGDVEWGCV